MKQTFFLSFAALLGGCTHYTSFLSTRAATTTAVERPPAQVEVFADRPPTRSYAEVGLVTVWMDLSLITTELGRIEVLREEAAEHGCDGILVGRLTAAIEGEPVYDTRRPTRAVCIVYTASP